MKSLSMVSLVIFLMFTMSLSGCLREFNNAVYGDSSCSDVNGPSPPEPSIVNFSGGGDTATEFVKIEQKVFKINATHNGSSNFVIWLFDSDGDKIEQVILTQGIYEGSKYIHISNPGNFAFGVTASGSWSISLEQLRPITLFNASEAVSGYGDTAFQPVYLECGLIVVDFTHRGDSNFIVWLWDANGRSIDSGLIVLAQEDYNGSHFIKIPRTGVYLFDITASTPLGDDGLWSLQITKS